MRRPAPILPSLLGGAAALLLLGLPARAQDGAFSEEAVSFEATPTSTIAGTVAVPDGPGPFPAVVLASGSGPQDRDGAGPGLGELRINRDLAHDLAGSGVLVLRADDRGVGESQFTGDAASVTSLDLADDLAAAVRYLAGRPDVEWIAVVGHSEGGILAPVVAGREPAVDAVVLVAAPAVSGVETILDQNRAGLRSAGVDSAATEAFVDHLRPALERLARDPATPLDEAARDSLSGLFRAAFVALPDADRVRIGLSDAALDPAVAQTVAAASSQAYRALLALDPEPYVRALRVPALALYFELDRQVTPALHAGPMREALASSSSPDWEVTTMGGVNHVLQTAETGSPAEYPTLPPRPAPAVLETITAWILDAAAHATGGAE